MSILVKGDTGIEKILMAADIASRMNSVIWVTSTLHPPKIESIFNNIDYKGNTHIILCKKRPIFDTEIDTTYIDSLSLNEISICASKITHIAEKPFALVLDNISESLAFQHNHEKFYLFIHDMIGKVIEDGGLCVGCMVKEAQENTCETLISSVFDWVLSIKRSVDVEKMGFKRVLTIEKWLIEPSKEILEFDINSGRIILPEDVREELFTALTTNYNER